MKKENIYSIIKSKDSSKVILARKGIEDENLQNQQKIREIREKIRDIINSNNPAFIRTLKKFLSNE
jgi:Holliday junction resolvasome RuvABC endonuclease subunit